MLEMNKVMLIGNLTRDPEPIGQQGVKFGVAMNKKWKDRQTGEQKEEVCFLDVVMWGEKNTENILRFFVKGSRIYIEGELKMDTWDDKNSGGKRSKTTLTGQRWQFADSKNDGESGGGARSNPPASTKRPFPEHGITREQAWATFRDARKATMDQQSVRDAWTAEIANYSKSEPEFTVNDWAVIASASVFAQDDPSNDLPF